MKTKALLSCIVGALIYFGSGGAAWGFTGGSTGALGAFNPTTDTEVILPQDGVLNYTTVDIPYGVTVTFGKNAANTAVFMLATGNVTVDGTIRVDGSAGNGTVPGAGGPGGFDGGYGGAPAAAGGRGVGPGGGGPGSVDSTYVGGAGGGGYGTSGGAGTAESAGSLNGAGGPAYGNERIITLVGGSGGGGGGGAATTGNNGGGGGGGGGALVIASSGTITLSGYGAIYASGGSGANSGGGSGTGGGGGSGGSIKLMASTITGLGGYISAAGGANGYYSGTGGDGRIRIEADTIALTSVYSVPAYSSTNFPGSVFTANAPTLKITSVGGMTVSEPPTGKYATPDITLPSSTTNPVSVIISATNIPAGSTVTVAVIPESGTATTTSGTLAGTDASSTATVSATLSTTYRSILTAQAVFTVQIAMHHQGERIDRVMVATTAGQGSKTVYITESGREIPSEELLAKLMK